MLFVQIGNQAFDPCGATVRFFNNELEEKLVSLQAANGGVLVFDGDDYDAFMDWWTRCANVSRFPGGKANRTTTVIVKDGKVVDVTNLPLTWSAKIKYRDNSGGRERDALQADTSRTTLYPDSGLYLETPRT